MLISLPVETCNTAKNSRQQHGFYQIYGNAVSRDLLLALGFPSAMKILSYSSQHTAMGSSCN
jgi:hypothetical protein